MKTLTRYMMVLSLVVSVVGLGDASAAAQQTQIPLAEYAALVALYESAGGANWEQKWALATNDPCGLYGVTCTDGHVTELFLHRNQLSGAIPPELGSLGNLRRLSLYRNQLSGAIPPELGSLGNLEELSLYRNELSGAIPPELGSLTNLEDLDLHLNFLSGAIPPELGSLSNLELLDLDYNQLSGAIPPELGNLINLRSLDLGNNQLSGALPRSLMNLSLYTFRFWSTGLCEPADAAFQAWLSSISDLQRTGVLCGSWRVLLPFITG